MRINNYKIFYTLVLMLSLHSGFAFAQEDVEAVVQPLKITQIRPMIFDMYLYGSFSFNGLSNLRTASNYGYSNKKIRDTSAEIGVEVDAYNNSWLRLGASLGYKYERYAYNGGFSASEGVSSHWLNTGLNVGYVYSGMILKVGVISDFYLSSRMKNHDNFSYEGINSDCFNAASFAPYFGMGFNMNRVKVEARVGYYCKTQLNPDKMAYYNLCKSSISGLFWEAKVAYRIFTTGKHYNNADIE